MKKIISLIIILITLTACGGPDKWNTFDPNMPEELVKIHNDAIKEHLNIIKEDPENTKSIFEVGYRYDQLGDLRKALEYYEKVLAIAPNHYAALNNTSVIYEKVEEYSLASERIEKLYSFNQDQSEVIKDLVEIFLKADKPDQALRYLENFAIITKDVADEALLKFISEQFESINNYKNSHENL